MAHELESGEGELSLAESINLATRRMAAALAIAGMAIGLGLWARPSPSPPRYQGFVTSDGVVRLNTRSGSIVHCQTGRKCRLVLLESQDLEGRKSFSFDFSGKPETIASPEAPAAPTSQLPAKAPAAPTPAPAPAPGQ